MQLVGAPLGYLNSWWQPGTSQVAEWLTGFSGMNVAFLMNVDLWLEVGLCQRTVIRSPGSLGYSQLTAILLPYQTKRVQKPILMICPSTYQLNTSFKQKGTQTSLTFSKIAVIQQICCKPEDRCITTKQDFVMNVLITVCHG